MSFDVYSFVLCLYIFDVGICFMFVILFEWM